MTDAAELLALWEQALPLSAPAREALLAHDSVLPAPASMGALRHRLLGRLHQRLGESLALKSRCPACGEEASFAMCLPALLEATVAAEPAGEHDEHTFDHDGWHLRFRLPAPDELPLDEPDPERFVLRLLDRCVIDAIEAGERRGARTLPSPLVQALSARMDALDPAAHVAFDIACPTCHAHWSAPFDPGRALWSLVQGEAEELLLDIDALAQRYGWSEAQILALPPLRRQAYLQLARGAS
jgi:hypothetical protein